MVHGSPPYADIQNDLAVMEICGIGAAGRRLLPWLSRIIDSIEVESPLEVHLRRLTIPGEADRIVTLTHDLDSPVVKTVDHVLAAAVDDMDESDGFRGSKTTYSVVVEGFAERFNFALERPRQRLDPITTQRPLPDPVPPPIDLLRHGSCSETALELARDSMAVLRETVRDLRKENARLRQPQSSVAALQEAVRQLREENTLLKQQLQTRKGPLS